MSYEIGQFRRSSLDVNKYTSDIFDSKQEVEVNLAGTSVVGLDWKCTPTTSFDTKTVYYFRFGVRHRNDSDQKITISLRNDDDDDKIQELKTFTVKQDATLTSTFSKDYQTYELIFKPNSTYSYIYFELQRQAIDFKTVTTNNYVGRRMQITINNLNTITNLINNKNAIYDEGKLTSLKKIGVQGPPGLMFTINGEEIYIGRSGVYELYNNNISINYLGFVPQKGLVTQSTDGSTAQTDYFIVDYTYEKED